MFLDENGNARSFVDVVAGGLSVGVPGVVAMLAQVHETEGALGWDGLFDDAIRLSEEGFAISPRLRYMITRAPWTGMMPDTVAYFRDEAGEPLPVGHILTNPDYAQTLRILAAEGPDAFYQGPIAEAIVHAVQNAPNNAALMTLDDLGNYRAIEREAICQPYRQYTVCGMGPPTSGGITVQMALSMLERFDLGALEPGSAEAVHLISEASRLAYADRDMYLADSDFVAVPAQGLLSPAYLAQRSALVRADASMGRAEAGNPWPEEQIQRSPDMSQDVPGTSHLAIVDQFGNALSMTSSVESIFGSHLMSGGMFLNNQLTDFSRALQFEGRPIANAPAPGKRPRSSMSPTIVLGPDGELFALTGSGGGARIIPYTLQHIIAMVDWGMSAEEAMALPRHTNRNGQTDLEEGTALEGLRPALEALGHQVSVRQLNSGSMAIRIVDGQMDGGADPRREGIVLAE